MSVEDIKKLKADKGFTIVELLIVIVVIGILVAIVIVAFTGITQQARDNGYKSNAESIRKVAETVNSDKGGYPTQVSGTATINGLNSSSYTKLPQGVGILAWPTTGTPSATDVKNGAENGNYYVKFCGGSAGVRILYPKGSAVEALQAGACS